MRGRGHARPDRRQVEGRDPVSPAVRHAAFRRAAAANAGITQRMRTKQLRALEDDRLIIRTVYAEVPPRVEYCLSEIGESLRPVIDTLKAWGESHQERLSCAPTPAKAAPRAP